MIYEYKCHECNEVFTKDVRMSEYKVPCEEPCPFCSTQGQVKRYISKAPTIGYNANNGGLKTTDNFKDRLREIEKNVPVKEAKDNIRSAI